MPGLGTIFNVAAIIAGEILGCTVGSRVPERVRQTLMSANAVAVIFLGIGGTLAKMLTFSEGRFSTTGTMMMIGSLAIGGVIGEILNLERGFERLGGWLREKTGNAKDAQFVDAFVTASLTVCIGAMAIVGSIEDGLFANHAILFAKGVLDFVIVLVMAASMGKGCGFAAIPVGIVQGSMTLLSSLMRPVMTDAVIGNISYIGSILIFCVGINLFFGKKIRVANLLPALVIAGLWTIFPM